MIPEKSLHELIEITEWDLIEGANGYYNRVRCAIQELLTIREQKRLLIEDSEKLVQILSDGAMPADALCICDFYNARDAAYEHARLMRQMKDE